jgi:glyoxylate reductase
MSPDNEMLKLDNVFITPHIGSADEETREAMGMLAAINVIYALSGKRIPNCINPEVYD